MKELYIKSTIDDSLQPSLFYKSKNNNRPLLVGLHTWSFDRHNQIDNLLPFSKELDWNLILPEFRGPNSASNPNKFDACGSIKAKQDVIDAVMFAIQNFSVDYTNIYLLGASGGGHMALLLSALFPTLWKGVCSFVPICDLRRWKGEVAGTNYEKDIIHCVPENEYEMRSPTSYIKEISSVNVKIFHGKEDKLVPFTHSLDLYNKIIEYNPNANVYLDIFKGEHELKLKKAIDFFISSKKEVATG